MGTALRIRFEEGSPQPSAEKALECLYRHPSKLDRICRKLALKPLSHFQDPTEAGKIPAGVSDTVKIVMQSRPWFPVADGLATLVPLRRWLEEHPTRFGILSDDYPGIIEDLGACIEGLQARADQPCRFHLGVVSSEGAK